MADQLKTASLKPSDATAGGLVDNINVSWDAVRAVAWDYNGRIPTQVPAVKIDMTDLDGGETYEQYYSVGAAKDWVPSADGKKLIAIGGQTTLKSSSNIILLTTSMVNAGYPEDRLSDDFSVMDGLHCHMKREAA